MKKLNSFVKQNLHWLILAGVGVLCLIFIMAGRLSENGSITLDGSDAKISESTEKFIEDAQKALNRIMNESKPTDEETERLNDENEVGLGFATSIDAILGRRLPDGNNDSNRGWQCSKYTAYLATGKREYSTSHPDYGPANGKDMVDYLIRNYGFKEIDTPVAGAIGSGGFNTLFGHTAMYLYSTGANTAMVNDANYVPLTVSTHNMDITGWKWAVPGDYVPTPSPAPDPTPAPTPAPVPQSTEVSYSYSPGDYFSKVLVQLGLDEGNLWGTAGTVKYYTEQLVEQGVLDTRGNVKLNTPFTLRRRQ